MKARLFMAMTAMISAAVCLPCVSMAADEPTNAELNERLTKLEKLVINDPFHPRENLLDRVDKVEKRVDEIVKADKDDARVQDRSDDDLDRTLKAMEKGLKDVAGRLDKLERQPAAGESADVKQLKRDIDSLERILSDLKNRVSRLESKR